MTGPFLAKGGRRPLTIFPLKRRFGWPGTDLIRPHFVRPPSPEGEGNCGECWLPSPLGGPNARKTAQCAVFSEAGPRQAHGTVAEGRMRCYYRRHRCEAIRQPIRRAGNRGNNWLRAVLPTEDHPGMRRSSCPSDISISAADISRARCCAGSSMGAPKSSRIFLTRYSTVLRWVNSRSQVSWSE